MGQPTPVPPPPPDDRLDSWKEIAAYLNRDITTVQRWEKREAMPVHRHLHDRMGSVYAFRAELDEWARGRNLRVAGQPAAPVTSEPFTTRKSALGLWAAISTVVVLAVVGLYWLERIEYFWRNPLDQARFQTVTDFDGVQQAAAVSRDGKFIAFLSDREGPTDLWLTQVGSGQFYNLTRGAFPELVNPSVRTLGFSPDGTLVTFWVRKQQPSGSADIGTWAVPTLGGQARPYLEGAAELDWTQDGSQLAYHTPESGDPLFVTDAIQRRAQRPLFTAPAGLHSHFPLWSPDKRFLYFVQGALPDKLDIWRTPAAGGTTERITTQNMRLSHPVFIDDRTLLYLAGEAEGSGLLLYSLDVERRIPHRLTFGPERYTSLAASADGRRLVLTIANPKRTLWRLPVGDTGARFSAATPISLTTRPGFSPRLGTGYSLYVTVTESGESIWKLTNGVSSELWRGEGAQVLGRPAISRDGRIAFSISQGGKTLLYVMELDGTKVRVVTDSLELQDSPAWAPDGQSLFTAANDGGVSHLFRVPVHGGAPVPFVHEYSVDPVVAPDGRLVLYSGPDIGTTFQLKAVTATGEPYPLPVLTLTRGSRHVAFLPGGRALVLLRGELQHKNLWSIDLQTGAERQLTNLPSDFHIEGFDISPDGREIVVGRVQDRSGVMLLDRAR